ncbi:MAG: hypothetical protein LLG14_17015 [Nocardiaceae bacterium]|nr:hypothetical protein [Nocardiaceae bacterium]
MTTTAASTARLALRRESLRALTNDTHGSASGRGASYGSWGTCPTGSISYSG